MNLPMYFAGMVDGYFAGIKGHNTPSRFPYGIYFHYGSYRATIVDAAPDLSDRLFLNGGIDVYIGPLFYGTRASS